MADEKENLRSGGTGPHVPPTYRSASTSKAKAGLRDSRLRDEDGRPLALERTHSKRDLYNADTGGTDSEIGPHSHRRHEEQPHLHRDHHGDWYNPVHATRSRSKSNVNRPTSSQSKDDKQKKPNEARHNLRREISEYEQRDEEEAERENAILKDVKSGHSGETVAEQIEKEKSSADLEKQAGPSPSSASTPNEDEEKEEKDPNLVTWDSPDSMENPRNWSLHRRWGVIAIVSTYTFLSPLSSSMIAPALPLISEQFHVTSTVLQSLMLSVFVLAYAVGPLFLAPLSEMFGRRIVLQISNAFFIAFTVACTVAQDRVQLSIFRFFAGLGGSAPLAVGGGTVGDLMFPEERGTAMAVYSLGPLLGPAIGPLIGGWVTQETGNWRWIFGVACIAAGVTASVGLFILPETYAPRILAQKAARLRRETGNEKLHTVFDKNAVHWALRLRHNLVRPFILIGTQPVVQWLALYMMIIYGTLYLQLTTYNSVFEEVYGESVGIASLNYISLAIGFTLGGQIGGRVLDYYYRKLKRENNNQGKPEFKLIVMMFSCWTPTAGLLIFGWCAEYKTHWIGPNIGAALFSIGMLTTFQGIQSYMVDCYTIFAASAIAANVFLRSLAGFALPLAGPTMYSKLGYGYGNTVLALIAAVVGIPAPFLLFKFGPTLRAKSKYASESTKLQN